MAVPLVLAITGLSSTYLQDWWLENLAVFAVALTLVWGRRRLPLSTTSYTLLFVFLCIHEYGALYSYSNTPLGEWAMPLLGTQRNHYDRLVHFLSGLMLFLPVQEAFATITRTRGATLRLLTVQFILAIGAVYEILEWVVGSLVDPNLGLEFIGAQGDGWDAAKDLACAFAGSLIAAAAASAYSTRANSIARALTPRKSNFPVPNSGNSST